MTTAIHAQHAEWDRVHTLTALGCPLCGAQAVVPLTDDQAAQQPDNTTHVCHPYLNGCNHGFSYE